MIVEPGIKDELRWFYEARFGMFVHFGMYALLERGEWVQYHENIPRAEYERLAGRFNPERFSADEWVALAEEAGAKYITVTAKHHDGFCLFDSALTDYKITNTPFGRDLIGELIAACRRRGMRIVLYYSQPDWHHPAYLHHPGAFKDLAHPPEEDTPDWPAYVEYYIGQVEELCTKYGRIDGIWFDGSHKTVEEWKGREVYAMIKKYQPHAIVNDRARCGDMFTPERSLPDDLTGYLFEACESISPTSWGYQGDTAAFSVPHLVKSLMRMTVAGGNYLLNVGPAPDGTIPEKQAAVMRLIGRWLGTHGQALYRTDPLRLGPPQRKAPATTFVQEDGVTVRKRSLTEYDYSDMAAEHFGYTRTGTQLFLHCIEWPEIDCLTIPGILSTPQEVRLLSTGQQIEWIRQDAGIELRNLPPAAPDAMPQIIAFKFDRPPEVRELPRETAETPVTTVQPDAPTELAASEAVFAGYGVKGSKLRVVEEEGHTFVTGWGTPDQEVHWHIACAESGTYRLSLSAGCPPEDVGGVILIAGPDEQEKRIPMPALGDDNAFASIDAGTLELPEGESCIVIHPAELKWGYIFGAVEKLVLSPACT